MSKEDLRGKPPARPPDPDEKARLDHEAWFKTTLASDLAFNTPEKVRDLLNRWRESSKVHDQEVIPHTWIPVSLDQPRTNPSMVTAPAAAEPPAKADEPSVSNGNPQGTESDIARDVLPPEGTLFDANGAPGDSSPALPAAPDLFAGTPDPRRIIEASLAKAARERKTGLPDLAERAFIKGFLRCLQQKNVPSKRQSELVSDSKNPMRKQLVLGIFRYWERDSFKESYVRVNVDNDVIYPLPPDEEIVNTEGLYAPFLLGLLLAQRAEGRIVSKDKVWSQLIVDKFSTFYSLPLGRIDYDREYRSIELTNHNEILNLLRERPSVQSLRFFNAIFPITEPLVVKTP